MHSAQSKLETSSRGECPNCQDGSVVQSWEAASGVKKVIKRDVYKAMEARLPASGGSNNGCTKFICYNRQYGGKYNYNERRAFGRFPVGTEEGNFDVSNREFPKFFGLH